ncbi:hypothetical protein Taro_044346, partial [Colocasia esculenta]|nr:hypothetical protein [Colocasia esculenta]
LRKRIAISPPVVGAGAPPSPLQPLSSIACAARWREEGGSEFGLRLGHLPLCTFNDCLFKSIIQKLFGLHMASSYRPNRQKKSCQTFSSALSSAATEWLLILLIYLDGFFSYLATKFAHYSNLQIPCLLCSRLDHLIGFEKFGLYKDLICHAHKLEISSLAYCHVHQKLADAHEVCETCLLSFATEKKPNPKTFRSLVGKFERNLSNGGSAHPTLPGAVDTDGIEVNFKGEDVAQVPLLKRDRMVDSPRTRYCSCCNELFHRKSHVQRLLQTKSVECGDGLLGQAAHNCLQYRDRINKIREKHLMSPTASRIGNRGFDRLSHIGYTQLKLTSDSESEVPFSDEDDGNAPVGVHHPKEYSFSKNLRPGPAKNDWNNVPKAFSDGMMLEKLIHANATPPESSHLVTPEQLCTDECHDASNSSMSEITITRDLGGLNWNEFGRKDLPSTPLSCTSRGMKFLDEAEVHAPAPGTGSNPVPAKDKLEVSDSKCDMGIADAPVACSTTYVEAPKDFISSRTELKQIQTTHKLTSSVINHMDPNDAYKLAIGYRLNQPSPRSPSRYHEDFKNFFSHISAGRGLEYQYNDAVPSPRVHGQLDDSKMSDASSTINHQSLGKKFINERNEPGFEFLDAGLIDEIEGESLTDRLKRQIELDRKFMSLLYKELEEERNAAAIAANQAMAMITRLQEEKAAMQMEALQYQRLMEEQAEYDQEALQETNDLLTEKEKEIQDLEAEIESYKRRLGEESLFLNMNSDPGGREDNLTDISLARRSEGNKALEQRDAVFSDAGDDRGVILKDSLLDLEDEKLYISECLKRLKKRLSTIEESHNGSIPSPRSDNEGKESNTVSRITDLTALENEVLHLSERLGALETDRSLLEHSINSLRNGNDGVQFIQEIASHLQELRRVGTGKREQIDV